MAIPFEDSVPVLSNGYIANIDRHD
jgi:hypothetical protein